MKPEMVPLLLCGLFCLLPIFLMVGTWMFLSSVANRHLRLDRSSHVDKDSIEHSIWEFTKLTREDLKARGKKEEKE